MSAGGFSVPMCASCGKRPGVVPNQVLGGWYCKPCDRYITSPSPDIEKKYNDRVAARKKEATS
jgi:ribosomal protein L37AE/L43A